MKIKIFLSKELTEVLTKLNCKASQMLLSYAKVGVDKELLSKDYANYISFSKEDKKKLAFSRTTDIIKYSELSEEAVVSPTFTPEQSAVDFWKKRRNSLSPGRIFSRILENHKAVISESDIESFSNRYVAEMDNQLEFELVTGDEIRKSYLRDKYSQKFGTSGNPLWQSCMNAESTQKFLDVYATNKNVSLLVVKHPHGIVGRALVWHGVEFFDPNKDVKKQTPEQGIFMDRCYYAADWIMAKMLDFAKSNGWYARAYQKPGDFQVVINPKGATINSLMRVKLENMRLEMFPYIDTMFIPNYKDNYLTNSGQLAPDADTTDRHIRQTSGFPNFVWNYITNTWVRRNDSVWIKNKLTYYTKADSIYSEKVKDYYLKQECQYSKLDNEYITPDDETANCIITNTIYKKGRMLFSNYHNGMVHKKESVETKDCGIVHKTKAVWSKTLGANFVIDNTVKFDSIDDYFPKEILSVVSEKELTNVLNVFKKYGNDKNEPKQQQESYLFEF